MKNQSLRRFVAILMLNLLTFQPVVQAATITLSTSPLANSTTDVVRPNLMYVLDDSGSMDWEYTPDYINDSGNNAMCWKSEVALGDTTLSALSAQCGSAIYRQTTTTSWTYANAGARTSASISSGNTGKIAKQTDNNSLWMLMDNSPLTWLHVGNDIPFVTGGVNYQYYNPQNKYTPPVKADGTSYPNASTTEPLSDGFLSTTGSSNLLTTGWEHPVWCNTVTPSPAPSASNIAAHAQCKENSSTAGNILYPDNTYKYAASYSGGAFSFTLSPWEYCTDSTLTSCIVSSATSGSYTEPSTLRWCAAFDGDKKYTGCQGRWDATHKIPKYLGYVATKSYGSLTVTDATSGRTITQITINGNNLLDAPDAPVTATGAINTTAEKICEAIQNGTAYAIANYDVRSGSATWGTCNSVASGLVEIRRKTADATDSGQAITVSGPGFTSGSNAFGTITIPAGALANDVLIEGITANGVSITPSISAVSPQAFSAATDADTIASTLAGLVSNGFAATATANVINITSNTVGVNTGALALVAPGVKAFATITVGTTGQTASTPADLGSISVTTTAPVTTQIVGHLTSAQLTNGTATTTNATTIRTNVGSSFTATNPTTTTVKVTAPTVGTTYNGATFTFAAGTPVAPTAGVSAVRPTGLITVGGSGTTIASGTVKIDNTLPPNTDVIKVGSIQARSSDLTIGNSKSLIQVASAIATGIDASSLIDGYIGGNAITPLCAIQPTTVVCLVDTSTYSNGSAVTVGAISGFNFVTIASTTATAGGNAGIAATPGVTNFAPALSGTVFAGGVASFSATGSSLSGGANLSGTVVVSTTPMTNGSPTPVRSEVGLFKRTDIIATAANGNTYKEGTLVANGTTMTYSKTAGRTDCITTAGICTAAEELQNFANWYSYYRYRDLMMKSTTTLSFDGLNGTDYNVGYDNISNCDNASCATSVVQGVGQFINSCTGTCDCSTTAPYACACTGTGATGSCQRSTWWSQMIHSNPNSATPLRASTAKIGLYYAAKLGAQTAATPTQNDPMEYSCQQNYMLLVTDGYWNEEERSSIKRLDGTDINNVDNVASGASKVERPYFDGEMASTTCPAVSSSNKRTSASSCRTMADITYYYYNTDLRTAALSNDTNKQISTRDVSENNVFATTSDSSKQQHMTFFGLGLGVDGTLEYRSDYLEASAGDYTDIVAGTRNWPAVMNLDPTAVDDLWHAAVNGHGKYFSARDPDSVRTGLTEALNSIKLRVGAAAAAATSNLQPTKTDNGAYVASYGTVEWWGELQARNIDVDNGGAVSEPVNDSPNECVNDTGCPWSAQKILDAMDWSGVRKVYIAPEAVAPATVAASGATLRSFTYANLNATEITYFDPTAGLSQYSAIHTAYPSYSTADLSSKLVDFLRGDPDSEQDGAGGDQLWRNRTHILGDIVNTQPVYVRGAAFTYDDSTNTGYDQYILDQADRQSVVYVSANDGYLHAFAAQDSTDGTTVLGGTELFAFMPSLTMQTIKELADVNYAHQYFVDGLLTVGDVYFDSAWHTILVGGLAGGGKSYYALDITDPFSPKYLWEISSATAGFENLGYTFGNASINKLPSGGWAVLFSSGYNNTDGNGYLYAVNPKTGALLTGYPLSTASGTAGSPSNLGKINAWVDNLQTNNVATDVYAGDMEGDLWRFNLATQAVYKLAHLEDAASPTPHAQPITTKPEMTEINSIRVIYVGTGQYLAEDDKSNTDTQSFYAIKDQTVPTGGWAPRTDTGTVDTVAGTDLFQVRKLIGSMSDGTTTTEITTTDSSGNAVPARVICNGASSTVLSKLVDGVMVVDKCDNVALDPLGNPLEMDWDKYAGWYVDLPDSGERMNVDMNLSLGTLTFGTNIPVSSACTTGGYGWLNYIDYKTGLNVPGTELIVSEKIANALIVGINVVKLPDGSLAAIVTTSDNKHTTVDPSFTPDAFSGKRSLWREFDPY